MATGMFSGGAAFGVFPQMQPRRRFQDPEGAANVPLDVTRGRFAGLAGLLPDALNFMGRSPMPTEMFGDTQYEPAPQLPYGSEYYLQNLPLKPTSRIGEVAGQAGAFVPLNPMPAARAVAAGVKALGPTAVRMGEGYLQSKGLMPNVVEGGAIPGSYEGSSVLMNPKNLTPLNKIEDANKYKSILNSMQEFGYQGRPILAYMDKGQAKALTGSHRLYAARNAGIDVPVVFVKPSVMKWEDKEGLFGTFKESINDQRVYQHLKAAGDDTAASLAKLEDQIYQPAGMLGGPIKPQAPVSELGFYSATEQAALNLPRKSGTGESFLNDLMKGQDVKKDELSWLGLDDYLKGKPNVTRQEVQDFISNNRVDVRERQLGAAVAEDPVGIAQRKAVFDKYEPEIQALYKEIDQYETNTINARNLASKNETEAIAALNREGNPQPIPTTDDWNRYYAAKAEMERVNKIPLDSREYVRKLDELVRARDAEANSAYVIPESTPTKYERYQLPGGENYREILLTMPINQNLIMRRNFRIENDNGVFRVMDESGILKSFKTADEAITYRAQETRDDINKIVQKSQQYQSGHFNEPNILAHMRVNDRVDADGKKMLLIEEIQSDWHQAGREKGYGPKMEKSVEAYYETKDGARIPLGFGKTKEEAEAAIDVGWKNLVDIKYETLERKIGEGVPDAPFKDTWHQLALKRALKYAADNGYDRVGLTTGRQQVDRYANQIRQNVDEIVFEKSAVNFPVKLDTPNIQITASKNGKETFSGSVSRGKFIDGPAQGKTVEEVLGKSMAKQIVEHKQDVGSIKGDDLTIGGEGMKAYYDEIYPAFLAKQGKKYNAKTGETRIKTGNAYAQTKGIPAEQSIRYIDISPEMRGGVKKGQPLFTAAPIGGIGLGAGTQDNEMPDAVRQYMADPRYSDPFADTTR